ncbi:DgyrCDS13289 [Dimorphilus gyrociliatus]|uniref:DgyrCDS13289 n=1 Tax=Dimorphilus gyrociliatus TaxID=2664684 RepID=A0A7I8WA86_9ANNE|nr:DgyrCDS13289 [Dimorphilus gyrociliatus]
MAAKLPPVPPTLRSVQHYLKTATEHDGRDAAVSYYCRLYAVQKSLQIDKKSPDAVKFITTLMDHLEQAKKQNADNEAIHTETIGHAHIEQYALKLFLYADNEDRSSRFGKNVVKSFYTAGMLFDVLETFGELNDDIEKNRKYAKWKATYIHKCIKEGLQPQPGPLDEEEQELHGAPSAPTSSYIPPDDRSSQSATAAAPTPTPRTANSVAPTQPVEYTQWVPPSSGSLKPSDFEKATKQCKHAISAMQYEDSATAVECLNKALRLLTTGKE